MAKKRKTAKSGMIVQEIVIDTDIFDALADEARTQPRRFNTAFRQRINGLQRKVKAQLSQQPGRPHYPLRWTSERQRRFVMAKLRRSGNLPYQRTGKFVKAWKVEWGATQDGGIFTISNPSAVEQFITGIHQQGFHADTGWYKSQDILADALLEAETIAVNLWGELAGLQ